MTVGRQPLTLLQGRLSHILVVAVVDLTVLWLERVKVVAVMVPLVVLLVRLGRQTEALVVVEAETALLVEMEVPVL